ncbi:Ion transport 2 [Paraglaciecola sp. T6c]|uniref:potassium channel family protein n=1 Tax=Pseudoalteromonas atlantica (strain T6c / ATCC BAA-1087) TaxID=3042615 RepID=UPI00005C6C84|nr:potassium channel family protein [Paraglaciecola sp. T6c]ABG39749.1 Ion transport 2 [Paraglaciecola sp. T6c]
MFIKIRKMLSQYFSEMRWYTLLIALSFYTVSSWCLMALANEDALTNSTDFIYWLVVTGSTVGYGDLSPTTTAGKYIVSLYVIPVGLSFFALVIGRVASWVSFQWVKGVKGLQSLSVSNHILVLGWNEQRTLRLLDLLLREREAVDERPTIVLCVRADITNPMPDKIEFVKVNSFSNDKDMDRACIADAKVVLMDNPEDDLTMTTALYCSQRNPNAQMVAYFTDETLANLLQRHCPNVECTPSVAIEMLAKSAFDPGSSVLHHDLLSVAEGQAQYSDTLPLEMSPVQVGLAFNQLKSRYNATLIGTAKRDDRLNIQVNPDLDEQLSPGDKVFYIAKARIKKIEWQRFSEE